MIAGLMPLDAIPDLSDTQVIVYTEYPGQAPQVVEDQVTYPLTTAMLRCRAQSGARLLVLRRLVRLRDLRGRHRHLLGAQPRAGISERRARNGCRKASRRRWARCDRRRLGLPIRRDGQEADLAELRTTQDWQVRFAVAKAEGVAEVASVGGFVKQYQRRRRSAPAAGFGIRSSKVARRSASPTWMSAAAWSNWPRPSSWCAGAAISRASPTSSRSCSRPRAARRCSSSDVARVELGPTSGAASPNSTAKARSSAASRCSAWPECARRHRQRQGRLAEIAGSLPEGTEIVPVYDRSDLIHRAIATLKGHA
jgi:Cu(I)/Ag(I) efflux system membrane protein CusA/SilA